MKNLLLTTALAFSAITPVMASSSNFNLGFYGGAALSSSTNDAKLTAVGGSINKKSDLGGVGGTLGLIAAYDHVMRGGAVLGIDVFGSWHNHEAKQNSQFGALALNTKVKMNYSFGTALKVGYMFDKTLAFARIGYINSHFKHSSTYVGAPRASTKKKNASGLLLGAGVDLPFGDKMALGLSYDFAFYAKQNRKS